MLKFVLRRFALLVPTLLGVVALVFFMIDLSPGDPARIMLGERANPEQLEKLRAELGLDQPLGRQFLLYLGRVVQGDLGKSIVTQRPVTDELRALLPATIELAVTATLFASAAGIVMGVAAARKRNSWVDYSTTTAALVGVSMPVFWLALVLIMIFSVALDFLPTGGRMNVRLYFQPITNFFLLDGLILWLRGEGSQVFVTALRHLVLPTIALGTIPLAIIARTTRSSMLEVLKQDYVKTARAAGVPERRVIYRYALRNALLPVITVIGIQFGVLLSGAILTETIFAWPGVGKWIYHSISARDFPAVQGGILFISFFFVMINLIVDLLYSVINPRIRLK